MEKLWPKDYSRKEILEEVNKLYKEAESNQIKPGRVTYLLQRAQLGLNYIESKTSKKINYIVILISMLTLAGTLIFSLADYYGDKQWQAEQLRELKSLNGINLNL